MQVFNQGDGYHTWSACAIFLLCAAAIQYSAIGRIYFAVLFVSLQFIVIIYCN